MADELMSGRFIQIDATGLPILHGAKNKSTRGHFCSYTDGTQVVMRATLNGKQSDPADVLDDFEGTLLIDGASAYNTAAGAESVVWAGGWAHAPAPQRDARSSKPASRTRFARVKPWRRFAMSSWWRARCRTSPPKTGPVCGKSALKTN